MTEVGFKNAVKVICRGLKMAWQLEKSKVLIVALGATTEIVGTITFTYASARLVTLLFAAVTDTAQRESVWWWLVATIASSLAINIGYWLVSYGQRIIFLQTSKQSSLLFLKQLCLIDIQTFHNTASRNMINKLGSGHAWRLSQAIGQSMYLIYNIAKTLAIIAVVATVAWWITPFLVLFLLPSLLIEIRTAKLNWGVWDQKGDEQHVFWGISGLMSRANNQIEIRAMRMKQSLLGVVDKMLTRFQHKQRKILRRANRAIFPAKVLEVIGIALTEIWLIFRVLYQGSLSVGSYIFYSGIVARINGTLNLVIGNISDMQETLLYAKDFYDFLDLQPSISQEDEGRKLLRKVIPRIEFRNVWFRYPGTQRWILKDLSFTIVPGEHVALVGANGAGKTTIIKLLLRFYDVDRGSIEINGVNIKDLSLPSWYSQLGTLFQRFNEYPLSVKQNIVIGDSVVDETQFAKALHDSGVDKIAADLPYGLETVLDSSFIKGVEPSYGQWQKVALARAFYRNPSVLILDEPTAAIDAMAEYEIFNNIFRNQATKSAIIISHRFSTVRRATCIMVLDDGRIIEEGTHEQLVRHTDGLYRKMFKKQAEGYR